MYRVMIYYKTYLVAYCMYAIHHQGINKELYISHLHLREMVRLERFQILYHNYRYSFHCYRLYTTFLYSVL